MAPNAENVTPGMCSEATDVTGRHEALLYRDLDELRDAVRAFVGARSRAGEPTLAVVSRNTRRRLGGALEEQAAVHELERIAPNPARLLPFLQDWLSEHDGHGRIVAEPVWAGQGRAETAEALRHEAMLNVVLGAGAAMLCAYDAAGLDDDALAGAEVTHPHVRDVSGSHPSPRFEDPLVASGGRHWPMREPADPDSVSVLHFDGDLGTLRRAVVDHPSVRALSRIRRDELVLAFNEAATNAVRHGDGLARARLWQDGDRVVSEISSPAPLADPLAGGRRPDPEATSGRGLWLINELCDLVEMRAAGAGVTLRMHVRVAG